MQHTHVLNSTLNASCVEQPLVVCALEFERRFLQKINALKSMTIECSGPGARAIEMWADSKCSENRVVILAGVAGALDPSVRPGSAAVVSKVVNEAGKMIATCEPEEIGLTGMSALSITSSQSTLVSDADKRETFRRTAANLVDLESIAFVQAAMRNGWRWCIIRGVSDGADDSLPQHIDCWVDSKGRTRIRAVLKALATNPALIGSLYRLGRNSRAAMTGVAAHIEQVACQSPLSPGGRNPTHPAPNQVDAT